MKKSIIYLGIAVLTFTNVISALAQQSFIKEDSLAQTVSSDAGLAGNTQGTHSIERRKIHSANSTPETIVVTTYQKTMEEIIAENNQIIESTITPEQCAEAGSSKDNQIDIAIETIPVCSEKSMEERILQDSQVIESQFLTTLQPITLVKSRK
ncbi:hypothetical protein FLJC2902T_14900 [Flavobacterium limnosediminis JC2902]|uniref:Uncharacterized protein n=1 Tax=Flavobacterium limnosediminis JC2902 TaxID=1341181 RepID=V6SQC8_9FLAO|nr:hypothetical protein [Flavobacterium limnosediminis]ESU28893.1 hypothetical protein FLJC2902T_14900 [Flavobacterium limnosediminis JC2902]